MLKNLTAPFTASSFALAMLLGTTAIAEPQPISAVDVRAEVPAEVSESAMPYWANIETDLEVAITQRLSDRMSDDGAELRLTLDTLSLASSMQQMLGTEETELSGEISFYTPDTTVTDPGVNIPEQRLRDVYDLTVRINPASVTVIPEGVEAKVFATDDERYYAILVETFADAVVDRIED